MTATAINLPLYRALKSLNVPDAEAQAAAEAALPDLSHLATKEDLTRFATKEELRAEVAGVKADIAVLRGEVTNVRSELKAEIAQAVQRQTTWLFTALAAAVGILLAAQRLMPPTLPSDAVRAIVAQTMRDIQTQQGAVPPLRGGPQP